MITNHHSAESKIREKVVIAEDIDTLHVRPYSSKDFEVIIANLLKERGGPSLSKDEIAVIAKKNEGMGDIRPVMRLVDSLLNNKNAEISGVSLILSKSNNQYLTSLEMLKSLTGEKKRLIIAVYALIKEKNKSFTVEEVLF